MLRRQLEIPPDAAKAFVRDMKAFFMASGQLMQDEIAAKQVWLLKQHLPPGTKLRSSDVKELFLQMKDQAQLPKLGCQQWPQCPSQPRVGTILATLDPPFRPQRRQRIWIGEGRLSTSVPCRWRGAKACNVDCWHGSLA